MRKPSKGLSRLPSARSHPERAKRAIHLRLPVGTVQLLDEESARRGLTRAALVDYLIKKETKT